MFELLRMAVLCGTALMIAFLVLLAMPASRLREIVLPFVGWAVAELSAAYVFMPFDFVPEAFLGPVGLVDDLMALTLAIASACTAMNAAKTPRQIH
jgi:uncharacterized membrane protein YkvA (DUF1232 family)